VIRDKTGDLYGTTTDGDGSGCGGTGCGTVFKIASDGTETVLHAFTGGKDGAVPFASLIMDKKGNLYGTTVIGGGGTACSEGCGTVFKLSHTGTETVLYSFTGGSDGGYPFAGLIVDAAGNHYGTTEGGGTYGSGTVFKLAPDGTETVLHAFNRKNGREPFAGLINDAAGNLYGTTHKGGANGYGTVFKFAPDGTYKVLHAFAGGSDGAHPRAALTQDTAGNLYGTTNSGGSRKKGTIFRLAPDGTETVLYSFTGRSASNYPAASLIKDAAGNLYGTTPNGGANGYGTVFKLKE
jgi:uncharacterized repeat protein (TIGR03803 family)